MHIRYSGIALSYNVAVVAFSGFAPLLATMLIRDTGSLASPALYVMAASAITLFAGTVGPAADKLPAAPQQAH